MRVRLKNNRGQTSIEFMLVLPFFLLMAFTVVLLAFRVIFAEMTLYSVFYAGRAASVGAKAGEMEEAAQSILPGISMSLKPKDDARIKVSGDYLVKPLIGSSGSGNLDSPLARLSHLKTGIDFAHFIEFTSCNEVTDDNPVSSSCAE